jgi:competence ComEA-like helix-hairpin-helix protein
VQIRALIDSSFAYPYYSEALDMLGVALPTINKHGACTIEVDNQPWTDPITTVGVPKLPLGDKLHHKFGLIDQRTVVTGSHNWSRVANYGNDETLLVVENPTVAAHYHREFERLYQGAILGVPAAIQRQVREQQSQCSKTVAPTNRQPNSQSSEKVNLNTASLAEIEALPGVGSKLAQRMIAARQIQPYRSLADLDQVSGVGPKLLERLRDRVTW